MDFANKIKKFLTSPKTVITLIIITLGACLIGFFVPQITDKSPSFFEQWKEKNIYTYRFVDRLQLNRVYTSYWFLTLVVLITISLGYSLYLQVKKNIRHKSPFGKGIYRWVKGELSDVPPFDKGGLGGITGDKEGL